MKKVLSVVLLSCLLAAGCSHQNSSYSNVSTDQAEKMISSNKGLIVVDVREDSEYSSRQGHVPGAINYPWSSGVLKGNFQKLDKSNEILVVCRSGGRSKAAASFLSDNGYRRVYNMLGGTNQWVKDGYKTEQNSK